MSARVIWFNKGATSDPDLGEKALAAAAATGDPAAVGELFDRFQRLVTRYIGRMVSGADVEDLVQATFLVVARGKARFDGRSKASTWLLGIATNVVRHHFRARRRRERFLGRWRDGGTGPAANPSAEVTVASRAALVRVQEVLDGLPVEKRAAFVLCELEGYSAREAAAILGASETAVWKRVSDTRRTLRKALGENDAL